MITNIFIDNFRGLSNLDLSPGRENLLVGRNGSGKTSFLQSLLSLKRVLVHGEGVSKTFSSTFQPENNLQTFCVSTTLEKSLFSYLLIVRKVWSQAFISKEILSVDGKTVSSFESQEGIFLNVSPLFTMEETPSISLWKQWISRIETLPQIERGDHLSSGQHQMARLKSSMSSFQRGGTLLLDDPELHLYPSIIQSTIVDLVDCVFDSNGQIFVSSHHPEVINYMSPGKTFLFQDSSAHQMSFDCESDDSAYSQICFELEE